MVEVTQPPFCWYIGHLLLIWYMGEWNWAIYSQIKILNYYWQISLGRSFCVWRTFKTESFILATRASYEISSMPPGFSEKNTFWKEQHTHSHMFCSWLKQKAIPMLNKWCLFPWGQSLWVMPSLATTIRLNWRLFFVLNAIRTEAKPLMDKWVLLWLYLHRLCDIHLTKP